MALKPQHAGSRKRIYSGILPPRSFTTVAMELAVVRATEWHRELIADLAAERARLREAQMVWIGGPATADQARLLHHMPDMIAVANAVRGRQAHCRLSDLPRCFVRPRSAQKAHRHSLFVSGAPLIWRRMLPPPAGRRLQITGSSPVSVGVPTALHHRPRPGPRFHGAVQLLSSPIKPPKAPSALDEN